MRRHLVEHVSVSDLCGEYGIAPSVFCRWQKQRAETQAYLSVQVCQL
jgi:transposase-like protein